MRRYMESAAVLSMLALTEVRVLRQGVEKGWLHTTQVKNTAISWL